MKIFRLLVAVSFLTFGISCPAQGNCVVDEGLQQTFEKSVGEKVGVNIVLKSQVEPGRMKALAATARDKRAAKRMVARELKEHSVKGQMAVLEYLQKAMADGRVSNITCHWIANVITCEATKDVIEVLASHPDVLAVAQDREVQVVKSSVAVETLPLREKGPPLERLCRY